MVTILRLTVGLEFLMATHSTLWLWSPGRGWSRGGGQGALAPAPAVKGPLFWAKTFQILEAENKRVLL